MKLGYKLTSVFLIFTLSIPVLFYVIGLRNQDENFKEIALENIRRTEDSFHTLEERDTKILSSALEVIVQDSALKEVYLGKNRERLYNHGQRLFQNLKNKYGITHFYFILPDGRVFLRMHDKEIYGDAVNRISFQKARDTKNPAWEIELGKTAFALRAIMPYYNAGKLIGYVELGEEIDHFLEILKDETNSEFAIIADKKYLDRGDWKSVRRAARLRDNWDDLEKHLVLSSTAEGGMAAKCFVEDNLERVEKGENILQQLQGNNQTFMCGGFELNDAGGRHIGAVLSLRDITDHVAIAQKANNAILRMAIIFFLVTFTAGILISRSITKPILKLAEAAKAIGSGDLDRRVDVTSTDEIGQMGTTFNDMVEKRKRVEEALIESEKRVRVLNEHIVNMLMAMSHDIRGPFVAIMATLKLLLRGAYGKMDESVANTLKDLLSRVSHLQGIAEDCLGKAHAVEGSLKVERQVLDLREDIIDPVLEELSSDIQELGITIDNRLGAIPAGTIPVSANKTWLKVVFRNLFKNAIKYGGKGCTIAFGFEDHGSYYRLNVYNSGKPISEGDRDKLFTKFGRIVTETKDSAEGIGLGLYLVKEIVRKHGGDIWYEAKHDGSDFVFTLPKGAE
ncbi:MAG: ATP-binding protein [Nitrospirae bacterium]|nr:ATP-binding protein [Nitrospirota bacterium]MCL5421895.1 ATP-binding protein [Nitrospirota bacterium]